MRSFGVFRVILALSFLLVLLPQITAQQSDQIPGSSGSADKTAGKESSIQQGPAAKSNSRATLPQVSRPVVFTGAVVQEDGTPPPYGAAIELDCGGSTTKVATVRVNGFFEFQLGESSRAGNLIPDASEPNSKNFFDGGFNNTNSLASGLLSNTSASMSSTRFMGCQLRAQLQGYRSSVVRLSGGPFSTRNHLGTIVIYPIQRAQSTAVSVASMLVPKEAKKSRDQARKALRKEKFAEAETLLKAAVESYPKYGEAWLDLGDVYQRQNRNEEARRAYIKAMETDSFFASPRLRLSWIALSEQKWQEAADFAERALALEPAGLPETYFVSALSNYNLNRLDMAEESSRQVLRLDSNHLFPQAFLILANILARKNDNEGSVAQLRQYLKYAPNAPDTSTVRAVLKEKLAQANRE